jgi:flagellar biosynthesis protein FlhB
MPDVIIQIVKRKTRMTRAEVRKAAREVFGLPKTRKRKTTAKKKTSKPKK